MRGVLDIKSLRRRRHQQTAVRRGARQSLALAAASQAKQAMGSEARFSIRRIYRALADLAVSGARVTVRVKLKFRNPDLQTPWFEASLLGAATCLS